ncbi:hypothetical protein BVG19_g268 [[Candida] boidinii]|nr:hypothetical protein BVG19_g268 [[Candida] boidinii]OWB49747.1 hypothetical protein B5S27_g1291 [[Candida] boidinii]
MIQTIQNLQLQFSQFDEIATNSLEYSLIYLNYFRNSIVYTAYFLSFIILAPYLTLVFLDITVGFIRFCIELILPSKSSNTTKTFNSINNNIDDSGESLNESVENTEITIGTTTCVDSIPNDSLKQVNSLKNSNSFNDSISNKLNSTALYMKSSS